MDAASPRLPMDVCKYIAVISVHPALLAHLAWGNFSSRSLFCLYQRLVTIVQSLISFLSGVCVINMQHPRLLDSRHGEVHCSSVL